MNGGEVGSFYGPANQSEFNIIGWWLSPTPLKNMKVKWDDYSQYMEKNMFQTPNQVNLYQRVAAEISLTSKFSTPCHQSPGTKITSPGHQRSGRHDLEESDDDVIVYYYRCVFYILIYYNNNNNDNHNNDDNNDSNYII